MAPGAGVCCNDVEGPGPGDGPIIVIKVVVCIVVPAVLVRVVAVVEDNADVVAGGTVVAVTGDVTFAVIVAVVVVVVVTVATSVVVAIAVVVVMVAACRNWQQHSLLQALPSSVVHVDAVAHEQPHAVIAHWPGGVGGGDGVGGGEGVGGGVGPGDVAGGGVGPERLIPDIWTNAVGQATSE